jgi:hypothetical protein
MRKVLLAVLFVLLMRVSAGWGNEVTSIAVEDATVTTEYLVEGGTPYVMWLGNYSGQSTKNFIKFTISDLTKPANGTITINSATFKWTDGDEGVGDGYSNLPTATLYQVLDNSWTETGITWDTAPAFGDVITTFNFVYYYNSHFFDVKDYVQSIVNNGGTAFSFGADAPNNYVDETNKNRFRMFGRTTANYEPKLIVDYTVTVTLDTLPTPVINPGNVEELTSSTTVSITDENTNAIIRYTLDGSDPTESSSVYLEPFTVSKTTVVRASAWLDGYNTSKIAQSCLQFEPTGTLMTSVAAEDMSVGTYWEHGYEYVLWMGNADSASEVKSYLKFSVPDLAKPTNGRTIIHSAIFKWVCGDEGVESGNNPPTGTLYQVVDNSWTETSGLTTYTSPAFGDTIATFNFIYYYLPIYFDLTNYLQTALDNGSTTISLGAYAPMLYVDNSHRNCFRMFSREVNTGSGGYYSASYAPKLIIDYTIDAERVATPTISPAGGAYASDPTVTIISATSGAAIYYTTDGTTPTESSTPYTVPFTVSGPLTITAIALPPSGSTLYKSETTSVRFDATVTSFNNPTEIESTTSTITCNGDLSEWTDAQWTQLTKNYDGNPTDVADAYYAAKWAEDGSKIYVAVKVKDTTHVFSDTYDSWSTRDAVEIYLHTNGFNADGTTSYTNNEPAQQYTIGIMNTDRDTVWTSMGANKTVPAVCTFQAGGKEGDDGQWLYYEVAMTPFKYMGGLAGMSSVSTPAIAGQVIGLDVIVAANNGNYTGMKSENLLQYKSDSYTLFGLHKLVLSKIPGDANGDSKVDVGDLGILAANYGKTSGATWSQGDFNGDGKVDVGDLGILAANYGKGTTSGADFDTDYAKVFGTTANNSTTEDNTDNATTLCSSLGLSLIAGLAIFGLLTVKLEE